MRLLKQKQQKEQIDDLHKEIQQLKLDYYNDKSAQQNLSQ